MEMICWALLGLGERRGHTHTHHTHTPHTLFQEENEGEHTLHFSTPCVRCKRSLLERLFQLFMAHTCAVLRLLVAA